MVNFQSGYRTALWNAKQITQVPSNISLDPTVMYPSNQGPVDKTGACSGVFFKFNVSPTSFDLDPYFFFQENDYAITARAGVTTDLNHRKCSVASGSHSVQPMVWKGPFYLSGWGYDICGLPVPGSGNGRIFSPITPVDRSKWKTGPVDLRWDDDRKVWTGGPEVIEGKMLTALLPGNFDAPSIGSGIIYRGKNLQHSTFTLVANNDGIVKPNPYGEMVVGGPTKEGIKEIVQIVNRNSKLSLSAGDYFSAVKINYEWRIMGAGGGGGGCIVGKFKKLNCSSPSVAKTTIPPFTLRKRNDSQYGTTYEIVFTNIGTRKIYYFQTDRTLLKDLIPSDSAGGKVANSNGIVDITAIVNNGRLPYSGYFSMVAFNNCEKSSNVLTYSFPGPNQYVDGEAPYTLVNTKTLDRLYDCPDSNDNFGIVTDDATGAEFYATHPFKYVKHDVRVIACQSNLTVVCNNETKSAYAITEVDDCSNAGTGLSRE